jgi:nitroreductase
MNQKIQDALQFRHACKDFLPDKKITDKDFQTIIESAHLAPSSFGFEPWKFLVVQRPAIREKLKECAWGAQNQLPNSSHFVIILAKRGHHLTPQAEYVQNFMREIKKFPEDIVEMYTKFYTQFQEEDFQLKNDEDRFDWAKRQTYIPLANMMHSAALLKVDSCPIEGFHEDKTNQILADTCGVDLDEYGISVMVAFGYRKEEPRPKVRQKIEQVVEVI